MTTIPLESDIPRPLSPSLNTFTPITSPSKADPSPSDQLEVNPNNSLSAKAPSFRQLPCIQPSIVPQSEVPQAQPSDVQLVIFNSDSQANQALPARGESVDPEEQNLILSDPSAEEDFPKEVTDAVLKVRKMAAENFNKSMLLFLGNIIANILGYLLITETIGYLAFLIILLTISLILAVSLMVLKRDYTKRKEKFLDVAHLFSVSIYLIVGILWYTSVLSFFVVGAAPGSLVLFIDTFSGKITQRNILIKWGFWGQLVLLAIKLGGVKISWPLALIILNAGAFVALTLSFIVIIFWLVTLYAPPSPPSTKKRTIIGNTWYLILAASMFPWALELITFENIFPSTTDEKSFWTLFVGNAAFCVLGMLFSYLFRKQILLFLKEQDFYKLLRHTRIDQYLKKTTFKVSKITGSYLIKLSCTYFICGKQGLAKGNHENLKKHQKEVKEAKQGQLSSRALYKPIQEKTVEALKLKLASKPEDLESSIRSMYDAKVAKNEMNGVSEEKDTELSFDDVEIIKKTKEAEHGDKKDCIVCCEKEADAVFMNCGHGGMCFPCALKGWKKSDKCHICRGNMEYLMKLKYINGLGVYKVLEKITKTEEKREIEL